MGDITLTDRTRHGVVNISDAGIRGAGLAFPRLIFSLKLRATRPGWMELHRLTATVSYENELLSESEVPGAVVMQLIPNDTHLELSVPVSDSALRYLEDGVQGDAVLVDLRFCAELRICEVGPSAPPNTPPTFPAGGNWTTEVVGDLSPAASALRVRVPRSDWFTQVLQSLGTDRYIPTEIRIPSGGLGVDFVAAVARLRNAEQQFFTGMDSEVFHHCRGAVDALPGAKKSIFAAVRNKDKGDAMDELTKALGVFLHQGRHVEPSGAEQAGEFPVDHRDAAFALYSTRLLVAYASQLLAG
jgi:hypothetical protein